MAEVLLFKRQKIGLVVCTNKDHFHGAKNLFLSYLIYNGKVLDEPDHRTCLKILNAYEGRRELVVILKVCMHCRKRGAKS